MKVAIVHEYLIRLGGAERVMKELSEMFPEAKIYTLLCDFDLAAEYIDTSRVVTSSLQKLPGFLRKRHSLLVGKMARAMEEFDFSEYDLVISSSNSFAHGVITNVGTKHICYYHSPTRYLWDWTNEYFEENGIGGLKRFVGKWMLSGLRIWDFEAAQRPEVVLANSKHVAKRISKYYRRESEVVYPPVELDRFKVSDEIEDYYLVVSTLTPFKGIDLAVQAFRSLGWKLKIAGTGKDLGRLKEMAGDASNIEFLGFVSDEEVAELMSKCKGFVFCGEEDFGITPVEVMASGRPVLAYGKGGLLETVVDGKTGMFFEEQSVERLKEALVEFDNWVENDFVAEDSVERSKEFSTENFRKNFLEVVNREMEI